MKNVAKVVLIVLIVAITAASAFLLWRFSDKQSKHKILLLVDLQIDFIEPSRDSLHPNQGLPVFTSEGNTKNAYLNLTIKQYIDKVATYLENTKDDWDMVVYSIDYHPDDHCSFVLNGNPPFQPQIGDGENGHCYVTNKGNQTIWPRHCVQQTIGSKIIGGIPRFAAKQKNIRVVTGNVSDDKRSMSPMIMTTNEWAKRDETINIQDIFENGNDTKRLNGKSDMKLVFAFKGNNPKVDSYSAFFGNFENNPSGLKDALAEFGMKPKRSEITVLGVAHDVCVKYTAKDAASLGFKVRFLDSMSAPVNCDAAKQFIKKPDHSKITIVK